VTKTRDLSLWQPLGLPGANRCPTGREDTEVRVPRRFAARLAELILEIAGEGVA
jgi:hypothetical protein